MASELVAVALIERDEHGGVLMSWSYPIVDEEVAAVVTQRSPAGPGGITEAFTFHKHRSAWLYTLAGQPGAGGALPGVTLFSVTLQTRAFNPEKYRALLDVMVAAYAASGDPLSIMEAYLSVFTTGSFGQQFAAHAFDDNQALIAGYSLKDAVLGFGLESVLLWNALVLRKRVVVFSDSAAEVQALVRMLPQLAWHRQDWTILRPICTLSELELADLSSAGVYCAGFVDPAVRGRDDLYDVFVDASERTITVAEAARADFAMGALHKDVAMSLMAAAEQGAAQQVIRVAKDKTVEVINKLKQLCTPHPTTGQLALQPSALEGQGLPRTLERFLGNFARAEGLLSS